MRTRVSIVANFLALLALLGVARVAFADACADSPAAVCAQETPGALALIERGAPVAILGEDNDFPGVLRAARDLQSDLAVVSGHAAIFSTSRIAPKKTAIIIGTLGRSTRIDHIVHTLHIDTHDVGGRWEAYLLQVVEHPLPGVDRALLIIGADKRGTIYGAYEISRRLGVSPWAWWADVPIAQRDSAYIAPGRFVDAPTVRYRGIFLNDEDPALGGWAQATYGGPNHRFYARVFELILRLKGNLLWPAMWGRAFADDDAQNPVLADEYGIVIGTSHHEPMMRAHVEWKRYGNGPWDYTRNADELGAFWRRGIERMDDRESIVTLGMRGDGDGPMTQGTAIGLLERIVADQRRLIADVTRKPLEKIPQVWALYKEVQDYFDAGMRVPDDVTLLFSDDNWGNLRRLPRLGEDRGGGYGIYYHFDYVGGPRNYKWINTNQIERVWQQMQLAYAYGVDRLWIVNVGDLKPMEFPISFFLDQAWNPTAMTPARLHAYPTDWATQQFGAEHAAEIGELLSRYTQYNARRKPELLSPDTFSLVNFHEADRVVADWQTLVEGTQRIGPALPAAYRSAWYELVAYPVLASANLNALYVTTARNHLYATQCRASTNAFADEANRLFVRDAELARTYENSAGGKWIHMMSQTHIGYTGWQEPKTNIQPALQTIAVPLDAKMGIAIEGDTRAWPGASGVPRLPEIDPFNANSRDISVFNRGGTPFRFTARTSAKWLSVTPDTGTVSDETTLRVEVDWTSAPAGKRNVRIVLRGDEGSTVSVDVPIARPGRDAAMSGFVESDGYLAIEASHFSRAIAPAGLEWLTIPNLGRTTAGVISWPQNAAASSLDASSGTPPEGADARLEYPIWLSQAGRIEVHVVLAPGLDFLHRGGLRYALSIGDQAPQIVTLRADPTPGNPDFAAWERNVSDNAYVGVSQHTVARAGTQTLKLWRIDPGLVFERIEIVRSENVGRGTAHRALSTSYLGPPESVRR